jgi:hypothetical protein
MGLDGRWLALIFFLANSHVMRAQPSMPAMPKEHRIVVHIREGSVYIPARVNGAPAVLLLDTGASFTVLSPRIAPQIGSDPRITIKMARGSATAVLVSSGFTLGNSKDKEEQYSFRRNVVVGDFKFGDADGVIGVDVLSSFRAVTFDFKNSLLILEER